MAENDVCTVLAGLCFHGSSEAELQAGLAEILAGGGIEFEREVELTTRDRIDFLTSTGIGIEVKVDGATQALTRQLHRYAQSDQVSELVVVTTRMKHTRLPASFEGKPITAIHVGGYL